MASALDAAISVFRERGYHATSVVDLRQATALASGSIYKAFKDKRAVFLAAFERYVVAGDEQRRRMLAGAGCGRAQLRAFLLSYAANASGAEGRRGCLVVGSAVEVATLDGDLAEHIERALGRIEAVLGGIIRAGQADGSLAAGVDPDTAARMMLCLVQGMRVAGKTGRTREEMDAVAELALRVVA